VSCNVRDVMLSLVASGKRKKMDTNEHHLYVEKAIMDETYGVARKVNIPADEAGQIRMAIRESLRDIGFKGCTLEPLNRASGSSPPNCHSSLIPTMFEGVLANTTTEKVIGGAPINSGSSTPCQQWFILSISADMWFKLSAVILVHFYETGEDLPQLKFCKIKRVH
jgi:hypothetical protein